MNDAAAFEPHSRRFIDDHSRAAIASVARPVTTGPDVVDTFVAAFAHWGRAAATIAKAAFARFAPLDEASMLPVTQR